MFKTWKVIKRGETIECLVYPLERRELGIIYPKDRMYETHVVQNPVDGKEAMARMVVVVADGTGKECRVDPFDFRWSSGMFCL